MTWINVWLSKLIHWPEKIKNKLRSFQNQISKNPSRVNVKWNLLFFIKNKVCTYLFKTRKVSNVICYQCFLKAFENQNGKLLWFFWNSHLRSSVKKGIIKISQKSQANTCVGVSTFINLHASGLQLYQKKRLRHRYFPVNSAKFLRTPFFHDTSGQLLLNFTNESKASENEI